MKNAIGLLIWVALYFLRSPFERIQIARQYRRSTDVVYGCHWVGGSFPLQQTSIRPLTILPPVLLAELLLLFIVVRFAPHNTLAYGFLGHLAIVGIAMSPILFKNLAKDISD